MSKKHSMSPKDKAAQRTRKEATTAENKKRRQARHQKALDKKHRKQARRDFKALNEMGGAS